MKEIDGLKSIQPARMVIREGFSAEDAAGQLASFFEQVIRDEAGDEAADAAAADMAAHIAGSKALSVAYCRRVLGGALDAGSGDDLQSFIRRMPADTLRSLRFAEKQTHVQLAVMQGLVQGVAMMREVLALQDQEDGAFRPGVSSLSPEALKSAQSALARHIHGWASAILELLPRTTLANDLKETMACVRRLMQTTHPKLLLAFLEALTAGPLSDVFIMQTALVKILADFADRRRLPPGMDVRGPFLRYAMLRELLFEAALRHVRYLKGLSVPRLVEAEAKMMLHVDVRIAFGSLFRLYLNYLLERVPREEALKERKLVAGFDYDGIHRDFIRDCIARRFSCTIAGWGRLPNAVDREQAVAGSRRDLKFYENKMSEVCEQLELLQKAREEGAEDDISVPDITHWQRPDVRNTVRMTDEDKTEACGAMVAAIRERGERMAVSAMANEACFGLLRAFYGSEPATGLFMESGFQHLDVHVTPGEVKLDINAMLFFDALVSMEAPPACGQEITDPPHLDLAPISFTQLECEVQLKRRDAADSQEPEWRALKVQVSALNSFLVPVSV